MTDSKHDKARIALAEAMNLDIHALNESVARDAHRWNPFTDANDDYAVLEWILNGSATDYQQTQFKIRTGSRFNQPWHYLIGDYARAACSVLKIEVKDD